MIRSDRLRRSYVTDDRLPPIIDIDMLDPDILVATVPEAAKGLHLRRKGAQQPSRGGCEQ